MIKSYLNKREKGKYGELVASRFLKKKGLEIIDCNYYQRSGEIDIIASENKEIVFVEVKSLNSERYINITETITKKKIYRLIKVANIWLYKHNKVESKFRIDFIGIVYKFNSIKKLLYIKNAIY